MRSLTCDVAVEQAQIQRIKNVVNVLEEVTLGQICQTRVEVSFAY